MSSPTIECRRTPVKDMNTPTIVRRIMSTAAPKSRQVRDKMIKMLSDGPEKMTT
ncbi:hypothetical protein [Methanosarcina mazei]|uniref:hypothetical protein n=1 Tax=Methanosarcina mazei TaxID=2209 RepID=UPI000AA86CF2|nr:hypothetical protein [Methanosarcina mazei]